MSCDPIADMLAMIKNANLAGHEKVDFMMSKIKLGIIKVFKEEGFIKNFKIIEKGSFSYLRIFLKNEDRGLQVITDIKRVSKPGRRIYKNRKNIPRIFNGLGVVVMSTSWGVITGKRARDEYKVGGEVLCYIW